MRDRTDKKDLRKGRLPRKNTLPFLHCPNWGWVGPPLPKSILTRFQKRKSCQHCVQGGGRIWPIQRKVFFWEVFLRLTSTIHAREVEVKDMYLPVQSRFVERHFGPLAQALD